MSRKFSKGLLYESTICLPNKLLFYMEDNMWNIDIYKIVIISSIYNISLHFLIWSPACWRTLKQIIQKSFNSVLCKLLLIAMIPIWVLQLKVYSRTTHFGLFKGYKEWTDFPGLGWMICSSCLITSPALYWYIQTLLN